jgi:hypothetical protein
MNNFLEFHETIKEKTNKDIPYLNYGGCGFFAYFMCKKLIMLGYQPKILVLERFNAKIEAKYHYLNQIKNNQKVSVPANSLSASHFVVQCGNYVFDSEDIIDLENKPLEKNEYIFERLYIGDYTVEDMAIALYRDKTGWNNWYCRLENNGLLYKIIKETQYV